MSATGYDTNGDGMIDSLDTNGDGKIDSRIVRSKREGKVKAAPDSHRSDSTRMSTNAVANFVGYDTNMDGEVDGLDTNGDGIIDARIVKIEEDEDGVLLREPTPEPAARPVEAPPQRTRGQELLCQIFARIERRNLKVGRGCTIIPHCRRLSSIAILCVTQSGRAY
jgi:hypothetical protein